MAEVDHQDLWQRATLTAALTGGSLAALEARGRQRRAVAPRALPERVRVERIVSSVEELYE